MGRAHGDPVSGVEEAEARTAFKQVSGGQLSARSGTKDPVMVIKGLGTIHQALKEARRG